MTMPPLNTSTLAPPPPEDIEEIASSWIIEHIWLPYVLLGLLLLGMALASFIHYHFQNRGKYTDKKSFTQTNRASSSAPALKTGVVKQVPKVGALQQQKQRRISRATVGAITSDAEESGSGKRGAVKSGGVTGGVTGLGGSGSTSSKSDAAAQGGELNQTQTSPGSSVASSVSHAAYTNESYDSNCDSDKSLLSPDPKGDAKNQDNSKKRPRSKSPRGRRGTSVEPAALGNVNASGGNNNTSKNVRKSKSTDTINKHSSRDTKPTNNHKTSRESVSSSGPASRSVGSASTDGGRSQASPPPATGRLETPVIPDNSRPRTQHRSRSGEVNVLKIHHEQDDDE